MHTVLTRAAIGLFCLALGAAAAAGTAPSGPNQAPGASSTRSDPGGANQKGQGKGQGRGVQPGIVEAACREPGPACASPATPVCRNGRWTCVAEATPSR